MNDNGKLKVYLDTSVVSHLWQLGAPEKMQVAIDLVAPTYFLEEE